MQVKTDKQLNILIGYPLSHSQSPLLHNTVYQYAGMNSIMQVMPHSELKSLIQKIKTLSVELTAVTMPFKEEVLQYLDDCSPEANIVKAANTLIQRNGLLYGYNTDIAGIAFAFAGINLHGKQVLVMGAGGAARAMGYFLKIHKAKIIWMNRNPNKADILAEEFGGDVIVSAKLNEISPDIIVNTTPVGLYPHVDESLLQDYVFNEKQIVFDMVYHPVLTQLLKQAKKYQATILSGLDMFIGQGLKQIELLTGNKLDDPFLIDELKKLLIQNQQDSKSHFELENNKITVV